MQFNEDNDIIEVYSGDHPFSEILAELEITPLSVFSVDADAQWSIYDDELKTANVALNLWSSRQDRLKVEYRFAQRTALATDNTKESFFTAANLRLTNQLQLFGLYERDFYTDTDLEYGGGILYSSQCWSLRASHTVEEEDYRYSIVLNLFGLGRIGT